MDLLIVVHIKSSYESWAEVFNSDPGVRSEFADEERTRIAKVDNNTALVQLFDVNMQKMAAVLNDPNSTIATAMAGHVESRELYRLEQMSPPS